LEWKNSLGWEGFFGFKEQRGKTSREWRGKRKEKREKS
jgi:hypothetical protein